MSPTACWTLKHFVTAADPVLDCASRSQRCVGTVDDGFLRAPAQKVLDGLSSTAWCWSIRAYDRCSDAAAARLDGLDVDVVFHRGTSP